jgi:hypothetical protein
MARRSKSQWRALIESQQASGHTAAEFCRQHDIDAKYFCLRKRQLGKATGDFIKVEPSGFSSPERASQNIRLRVVEVELPICGSSESDTLPLLLDRLLG